MPITKFKQIKNLAVFQNFDWDTSLKDKGNNVVPFSTINIIYGRNYSGKTTLSRIIRALELGKISEKYENPDFSVSIKEQADITPSNLTGHTKKVRVFNEDFVRDNLRFISNPNENIVPFAILGGNTSLEAEIEQLTNELGHNHEESPTGFYLELKNSKENYKTARDNHSNAVSQLNNQLSQKALSRENGIKYKPERFGDQNYNSTKLENEIKEVLEESFQPISDEKRNEHLSLLEEKPNISIPSIPIPRFPFNDFLIETEALIVKPISESGKIEQLVKDSVLNRWVKEGRNLHRGKLSSCAFCGNGIHTERWEALDKHFDEESEKLTNNIDQSILRIDREIQQASNALVIQKNIFYSRFHSKLDKLSSIYSKVVNLYKQALGNLKTQLEIRRDDIINPKTFNSPINYSKRLILLHNAYENIRNQANNYSNQLSVDQNYARKLLRLREVYDFAKTIQYVEERTSIERLKTELDNKESAEKVVANKIDEQKKLIEDKQRLLNDEEKGALKVNEYLNNYFGHNFLTLKAIEETDATTSGKKIRFEVVRNEKKAHHLSEGECSLIAFCYFMAKLEDIDTKGVKPIIWIDDPISSLDGNHIFFIYSLINSEIVSKKEYEQLFISTHNLDFLKYLKRLPGALNKKDAQYFIVVREDNISRIKIMPKYLKDYVTEFNYLFHQIYICATSDIEEENQHLVYYNFANNARKFLEAFLFYKYPNAVEHDDKLFRFFGDNQQASSMTDRISNEYSHLEGIFERSMVPIDVPEMKKVAAFVLKKIKEKDGDQYDSLLKSIGVEVTVENNN